MAKATVNSLGQQLAKVQRQYKAHYAGKSRHTRNLGRLESMLKKLEALKRKSSRLAGPAARQLEARITQTLTQYRQEHLKIGESLVQAPQQDLARESALVAQLLQARYTRHFGGQSRLSCDLPLLKELRARSVALREAWPARDPATETASERDQISRLAHFFGDEITAIEEARAGMNEEQEPVALAHQAQRQVETYRVHFANKSRAAVSAPLLARVISELERIGERCTALLGHQGDRPEPCAQVLALLEGKLPMYRQEHAAILESQQPLSRNALGGALGGAANAVMATYKEHFAGQARATRDLRLCHELCEGLAVIETSMDRLEQAGGTPNNRQNREIVRTRLKHYEDEALQIAQAQSEASNSKAPPPSLDGLIRVERDPTKGNS